MADSYRVRSLKKPAQWTVEVPGSKSITNRALLLSALCKGHVYLHGVLFSDDSRHFLSSLQSLGYDVRIDEGQHTVELEGCGGVLPVQTGSIHVGSAGTAARFLTAMLGVSEGTFVINASEQMQKRPMQPLFEALISLGASVEWLGEAWHLPVRITGAGAQIRSLEQEAVLNLDISTSTQFLSALLMVAPMLENGLKIHITSRKTDGSYIRITTKMMHQFGCNVVHEGSLYAIAPAERYIPGTYQIEPDVSAACYFYAAAALTGGHVIVKNVHSTSMQGDMKFIDVLKQMGCAVTEEREGICVTGPKDGVYSGVDIDMNDFSDQTMTLAALAPFAQTPTYIRNIGHIRLQESDRIHAIVTELTRLGIEVKEEESAILIYPGTVKPGIVSTYDDHRMAMAFALLGIRAEGIVIDNCECCRKTFEDYFKVLDRVLA